MTHKETCGCKHNGIDATSLRWAQERLAGVIVIKTTYHGQAKPPTDEYPRGSASLNTPFVLMNAPAEPIESTDWLELSAAQVV